MHESLEAKVNENSHRHGVTAMTQDSSSSSNN